MDDPFANPFADLPPSTNSPLSASESSLTQPQHPEVSLQATTSAPRDVFDSNEDLATLNIESAKESSLANAESFSALTPTTPLATAPSPPSKPLASSQPPSKSSKKNKNKAKKDAKSEKESFVETTNTVKVLENSFSALDVAASPVVEKSINPNPNLTSTIKQLESPIDIAPATPEKTILAHQESPKSRPEPVKAAVVAPAKVKELPVPIVEPALDFVDPLSSFLAEQSKVKDDVAKVETAPPVVQPIPVPAETAPKYTFQISVSDPSKVSDTLSAHITYRVKTETNHPSFRNAEVAVNRRYRDFLWLYTTLVNKYPGVVVPPVPEKHALGRFAEEFVETRRAALERCLQKISRHDSLVDDDDLRIFLESESFSVEKRDERRSEDRPSSAASTSTAASTATGFFGRIANAVTGSGFTKTVEVDEWFDQKKFTIESLESQLKALMKCIEMLVKHRRDLGAATMEFGETVVNLATVEIHKPLKAQLEALGAVHKKMKELHDKQAKHDINHLATTVDEYIRLIGSIKTAMITRLKSYSTWQTLDRDLSKKRDSLDKLRLGNRLRTDKISALEKDVEETESGVGEARQLYDRITKTLKIEFERFDREKVGDFTMAVRALLNGLMETQRDIIALWESYFTSVAELKAKAIAEGEPAIPGIEGNGGGEAAPVVVE